MNKILVIKHGSLGDIVFSLNSIKAIRNKYSKSAIHLLTEERYLSFFYKSKFFDKIIIDNRKNIFIKTISSLFLLLKENYDLIIDLQNSQRTSLYNLFFRIFGKSLICSSRPFSHYRYKIPDQGKEKGIVGLANQLKLLNININLLENNNNDWLKTDLGNEFNYPFVLIIPGVSKSGIYKQWQPENFAKVAKYCELQNFNICLVGTNSDLTTINPIIKICNKIINKIDLSPPDVIYSIASKAKLIISNDTGPGHVASLSNTNIIWILNDNKISNANIVEGKNIHKIVSSSVKKIDYNNVINYIEKNNLLNF